MNTNPEPIQGDLPAVRTGIDLSDIYAIVEQNMRRLREGLPFAGPDPHRPTGCRPRFARWEAWDRANPTKRMPARPKRFPVLTREVFDIYNALAFAMRRHGVVMNSHLTFAWEELGIESADHATEVLTRFNHEASKWLGVGLKPDTKRKSRSMRAWMEPTKHMYVYVHENSRDRGFHTHQLAFIPPAKAAEFETWARSCLARMAYRPYISKEMLCIRYRRHGDEASRVRRMWYWFRYITKTLDPNWFIQRADGRWLSPRQIFRPRPFYSGDMVDCAQLAGGSHNIWTGAQTKAGFQARLYREGWQWIYNGAELDDYRQAITDAEWERTASKLVL